MGRRRSRVATARSLAYTTGRVLGDVRAVQRATRTRSARPLLMRVWNRLAGRAITGQVSRRVWTR